jgi:hypothetical protein
MNPRQAPFSKTTNRCGNRLRGNWFPEEQKLKSKSIYERTTIDQTLVNGIDCRQEKRRGSNRFVLPEETRADSIRERVKYRTTQLPTREAPSRDTRVGNRLAGTPESKGTSNEVATPIDGRVDRRTRDSNRIRRQLTTSWDNMTRTRNRELDRWTTKIDAAVDRVCLLHLFLLCGISFISSQRSRTRTTQNDFRFMRHTCPSFAKWKIPGLTTSIRIGCFTAAATGNMSFHVTVH